MVSGCYKGQSQQSWDDLLRSKTELEKGASSNKNIWEPRNTLRDLPEPAKFLQYDSALWPLYGLTFPSRVQHPYNQISFLSIQFTDE